MINSYSHPDYFNSLYKSFNESSVRPESKRSKIPREGNVNSERYRIVWNSRESPSLLNYFSGLLVSQMREKQMQTNGGSLQVLFVS